MQTGIVAVIVALGSMALALAGLHFVRQRFPHPVREANNEVAGFLLAVLGVIYAVLLAFVLIDVWEEYQESRVTAEQEANSLVTLYRVASGLPAPVAERFRELVDEYALTMVEAEWPAMSRGERSLPSTRVNDQ